MRERLRRFTEDETVGKALMIAGAIFLAIRILPWRALARALELWPLLVIGVGVGLIVAARRKSTPAA